MGGAATQRPPARDEAGEGGPAQEVEVDALDQQRGAVCNSRRDRRHDSKLKEPSAAQAWGQVAMRDRHRRRRPIASGGSRRLAPWRATDRNGRERSRRGRTARSPGSARLRGLALAGTRGYDAIMRFTMFRLM